MAQLPPQRKLDVLPVVEDQIGGLGMTTWRTARIAVIFVATVVALGAAYVSAALAEIIPLVTIAVS